MGTMRCRQIKDGNIVWFNSCGKDNNNMSIKADNFVDTQLAVSSSLIQRCSIIKGELWYRINYGLPLFDKISSKAYMDTAIINQVLEHPDVVRIMSFKSNIINKKYQCDMKILSKYGEIEINI